MGFNKFLIIISIIFYTNLASATCSNAQNCLDEGISYTQSNTAAAASNISTAAIESAVGTGRVTDAKNTQQSITDQMGGDFKNIDKMNNAGNTKAAACQGKNTPGCNAYNYYNDPLTRKAQQSVDGAMGSASDLLNKKITEGIDLKTYCSTNPNDTLCKLCQKDPSKPMCQEGNKCTTISYNTTSGGNTNFACEILGQRSFKCNKWVDDVISHTEVIPATPANGGIAAQGSNQDTSKTMCAITVNIVAHEDLTKQEQIKVNVTNIDQDGSWNQATSFIYPMNGGKNQYLHIDDNNGNTHKQIFGEVSSSACNGNSCSIKLQTHCSHGQLGGNDWDRYAIVTLNYTKPKISSSKFVIDNVSLKDNCNQ